MSDITSNMISFPINSTTVPGYLAQPSDVAAHSGVVVIQEWWGLTPHIKDVADRFARAGYAALAPDLYHGQIASEPDEARKLAMALDRDRAVAEILAAARFLQQAPAAESRAVGVVGWCMGGGLSLSSAANSQGELRAAVVFYGSPLSASDTLRLRVPVLGLYASLDRGIPVSAVREFEAALKENWVTHEIHVYEGAQHAFFNDSRPHIYDEAAAADAWRQTLGWFGQHLV